MMNTINLFIFLQLFTLVSLFTQLSFDKNDYVSLLKHISSLTVSNITNSFIHSNKYSFHLFPILRRKTRDAIIPS